MAGLRLRSGAFAPDCPFVNLVQAYGLPYGFPRAHLHAPPSPRLPRHSLTMRLNGRFWDCLYI